MAAPRHIRGVVIVTRGADGVLGKLADGTEFTAPALRLDSIVDTVGCGDAFNAGFLSQLMRHPSGPGALIPAQVLQQAAEVACINASFQVLQRGAAETVGTDNTLKKFAQRHGVEWSPEWALAAPCPPIASSDRVVEDHAEPGWGAVVVAAASAFILGVVVAKHLH